MDGSPDLSAAASSPFAGLVLGLVIGLGVSIVINAVLLLGSRQNLVVHSLARRTVIPLGFALALLGGWAGFTLTTPPDPPDWYAHVSHGLLVGVIIAAGWVFYASLNVLGDKNVLTNVRTGRDARRFRTQAQILRRASQGFVIFLTVILVLLTFPAARAPMASVLASAGLLSVVAGLAAQTTLGNMFAGLQLAFTDAIRVGDNIIVPGQDQPGRVEEITLTYVVVQIWDERRVILPSSQFTTQPFENWTRDSASQLGYFTMQVDWRAPVAEIREELRRLLHDAERWDGRMWSMQVYDLTGPYMTLKITVSSANWARLQDLLGYLRENLVSWIRDTTPWAIPRERVLTEQGAPERPDMPTEAVDPAMVAAPELTGPFGGGEYTKEEMVKPDPDGEIKHQRHHDRKVAKKQEKERLKKARKLAETQARAKTLRETDGKGVFSGSAEAERRAALFDGPGKETFWHRTLRKLQRAKDEAEVPIHGKFDEDVVARAQNDTAPNADVPQTQDTEPAVAEGKPSVEDLRPNVGAPPSPAPSENSPEPGTAPG